jgi:hypothetical protein
LLESAVGKSWPTGSAKFYKFGTKSEELTSRRHLDAARQDFYNDAELNKKTYIENVLDAADTNSLTVIVTDLFQDKSDVNLIVEKLRDKYINNSYSIGILGIRSQFNGMIYDVGVNNYSFQYQSIDNDPSTYRPFYVLILGRHPDVQRYFESLGGGGLSAFPQRNFVVLSRYFTNPPTSFEGSKMTATKNIVEVESLLPTGTKNTKVKQFQLRSTTEPASFSSVLKYTPLPSVMEPEPSFLNADITAWKCEKSGATARSGANTQTTPGELKDSSLNLIPEAPQALTIKEAGLAGTELKITAEIIPSSLPGDGTYCFRIQLRAKAYATPLWFTQWNMTQSDVEAWRQNTKGLYGATTLNIKDFMESLFATVLQSQRPKVADLYLYIKRG